MINQPYVWHENRMGGVVLPPWSAGGENPQMLSCGRAQSEAFEHTGRMRYAVLFERQAAETQNEMTKA